MFGSKEKKEKDRETVHYEDVETYLIINYVLILITNISFSSTIALPMNIRLENKTFAQFNGTSSINPAHFWPSIRIQIQRHIVFLDR